MRVFKKNILLKKTGLRGIRIKNLQYLLLGAVLLLFLAITLVSFYLIKKYQYEAIQKNSERVVNHVISVSARLFEESQSQFIVQKSQDVAKQLSVFLKTKKDSIHALVSQKEFQDLTVQPVGDKGYTALFQCSTGRTVLHKNPALNGKDLGHLKDKFPDWWKIYDRRKDCESASGFYYWKDADGEIRKKFMAVSPVKGTDYMLAATTYLDEFDQNKNHVRSFGDKQIHSMQSDLSGIIDKFIFEIILVLFGLGAIFFTVAFFVTKKFSRFVYDVKWFCSNIGKAKYDSNVPEKSHIIEFDEIFDGLDHMRLKIVSYQEELVEKTKQLATVDLSNQVAHDIKSPLIALNVAALTLNQISENTRTLIRSAIQRIHDIANDLGSKKLENGTACDDQQKLGEQLICCLLDSLVSEKRMQYRLESQISIDFVFFDENYGLFSEVDSTQFKRIFSNLINNSVESLGGSGHVEVFLKESEGNVFIEVVDNGKGIPKDVLPKLTQKGSSFGKKAGSGLGLYHAKKTVESWGGSLEIESETGVGTRVSICLKKSSPPRWFVPELNLSKNTEIVILDDDHSIHQVWKSRFSQAATDHQPLHHFSKPQVLMDWYQKRPKEKRTETIFLCDYELIGQDMTGLDVIEDLGIAEQSILVTSRYEEEGVRARCENLGVRLIPKNLAGFVPINIKLQQSTDYVLIDDEKLNHLTWQVMAKQHNVKLETYFHPDEFFAHSDKFSKKTKIYIDSDLGIAVKGEEVAKEIKNKGFEHIYLATGSLPSRFGEMPWIEEIVDKKPPFKSKL